MGAAARPPQAMIALTALAIDVGDELTESQVRGVDEADRMFPDGSCTTPSDVPECGARVTSAGWCHNHSARGDACGSVSRRVAVGRLGE
ncbi:hypothetical protein GCM10010266_65100 [Streptomyces griseomycini]|nr:hypothetical protein GCM10010266_65100 [Streptomyces griseomycini]GGR36402.1 hypothetical protein GCM10015536_47780 [Streptomyces griseomycini]